LPVEEQPSPEGNLRRAVAVTFVKDERQRLTILYSGNVQGVGFRYAAREVAEGFDVCGTVRNLPDGRVELVAEGDMRELESFRQAIRESGVGSLIRNEVFQTTPPRGEFKGFQILR
jgi:acylphosphatase